MPYLATAAVLPPPSHLSCALPPSLSSLPNTYDHCQNRGDVTLILGLRRASQPTQLSCTDSHPCPGLLRTDLQYLIGSWISTAEEIALSSYRERDSFVSSLPRAPPSRSLLPPCSSSAAAVAASSSSSNLGRLDSRNLHAPNDAQLIVLVLGIAQEGQSRNALQRLATPSVDARG